MKANSFSDLRSWLHRGDPAWGWYVWRDDTKQSVWSKVSSEIPIPQVHANLYFNVHPCNTIKAGGERNKNADTAAINSLYGDFDVKHFGSFDTLVAHIRKIPIRVSVVNFSGGGYHCYWLLKEPFVISDSETRLRASTIQEKWVEFIRSDKSSKDLARILRIPGTRNVKPDYAPDFPTTKIVFADFSRLYQIEQFERLIPQPKPRQEPKPQHFGKGYVEAALKNESERVLHSIEGSRNSNLNIAAYALGKLVNQGAVSRSRVEGVLVCAAIGAGLPAREAERTVRSGLDGASK